MSAPTAGRSERGPSSKEELRHYLDLVRAFAQDADETLAELVDRNPGIAERAPVVVALQSLAAARAYARALHSYLWIGCGLDDLQRVSLTLTGLGALLTALHGSEGTPS